MHDPAAVPPARASPRNTSASRRTVFDAAARRPHTDAWTSWSVLPRRPRVARDRRLPRARRLRRRLPRRPGHGAPTSSRPPAARTAPRAAPEVAARALSRGRARRCGDARLGPRPSHPPTRTGPTTASPSRTPTASASCSCRALMLARHAGDHAGPRACSELADDSPQQLDAYLGHGRVLVAATTARSSVPAADRGRAAQHGRGRGYRPGGGDCRPCVASSQAAGCAWRRRRPTSAPAFLPAPRVPPLRVERTRSRPLLATRTTWTWTASRSAISAIWLSREI